MPSNKFHHDHFSPKLELLYEQKALYWARAISGHTKSKRQELRSINQGGGKVSRIKIRPESPATRKVFKVIISPRYETTSVSVRIQLGDILTENYFFLEGSKKKKKRRKMEAPRHKSDWNKVLTACSRQTYERWSKLQIGQLGSTG